MIDCNSPHILLIHPPITSPALPPRLPAQTAAGLARLDVPFELYDANLDFWLDHLLTPQLLAVLRDKRFYQPEPLVTTQKEITALLSLVSRTYAPSRFHWDGFFNPALQKSKQIDPFLANEQQNPFLTYCREKIEPVILQSQTNFLIICVSTAGQLLAALTMARYCRLKHPSLPVALQSTENLPAVFRDRVDHVFSANDPQALGKLICTGKESGQRQEMVAPDFSRLPIHEYLAPFPVFPFQPPDVYLYSHSASFGAYVAGLKQKHTLSGLLMTGCDLNPAVMAARVGQKPKNGHSVAIGLKLDLNRLPDTDEITDMAASGVRLIRWRNPALDIKRLFHTLRQCTKSHIWNHIEIPLGGANAFAGELMRRVASNPNIAHSWSLESGKPWALSHPFTVNAPDVYSQVYRLPGRPLGYYLCEPVYLLHYLQYHGFNTVRRWHIKDDPMVSYTLGERIVYRYMKPADLPGGYLDEICRMVEAGGSVGTKWVRHNLKRAFLIGIALEQGVIVGNSSLKHPRTEYVKAVSRQSGIDLNHFLERGYTSVRPEYRGLGIGTKLLEGLTSRAGDRKVFSIIGSDNVGAQKMALRNHTRQVATFYSERAQKELGVWIPARML